MNSKDSWIVSAAEAGCLPLVVRVRNMASKLADKDSFPDLISVLWRYESPSTSGMPSTEVEERMNRFEDILESALERTGHAILIGIVTGRGVREWQWYSRDANESMNLADEALRGCQRFPVEFEAEYDPQWRAYQQYQGLVSSQSAVPRVDRLYKRSQKEIALRWTKRN